MNSGVKMLQPDLMKMSCGELSEKINFTVCPNKIQATARLTGRHHHVQTFAEKFLLVTGGRDQSFKLLPDLLVYSCSDSCWKFMKLI